MAAAAAPKPKPKRVQSHPPKKSSGTFFFGHQNENVGRALNVVVVIVGFDLRTEKLRAEVFFSRDLTEISLCSIKMCFEVI